MYISCRSVEGFWNIVGVVEGCVFVDVFGSIFYWVEI